MPERHRGRCSATLTPVAVNLEGDAARPQLLAPGICQPVVLKMIGERREQVTQNEFQSAEKVNIRLIDVRGAVYAGFSENTNEIICEEFGVALVLRLTVVFPVIKLYFRLQ